VRLTFLGTGTSFGVPVVGCGCATCTSDDVRDRRTRTGALVDLPGGRLLVDAPPELRLQLLREGTRRVDAVWITHPHADHVHGLDDLRIFTMRSGRSLPAHVAEAHARELSSRFPYVFDPTVPMPPGTDRPRIDLHPFGDHDTEVEVLGARLVPLAVPHGPMSVYGFRVGTLGFVTDAKALPPAVVTALEGVDTLVLNALWWGRPHPTHFNVEEAVAAARAVGARRTYLIHLTHRVRHAELEDRLPADVRPAYDGLSVEV
jgi:phosphoribosyl 1,2-cyclic phosphate phosphodiesterase